MKDIPKNPPFPMLIGLVRTIRDCCQKQEGTMCGKLALTPSQFACLMALPESPAEMNVHQIAKVMGLSPSRTSRIIDSLVHRGLFSRRTTNSDRRTQLVALTSVGQEKSREAQQLMAECEEKLLAHLPPQRRRELEETLKTLINAW